MGVCQTVLVHEVRPAPGGFPSGIRVCLSAPPLARPRFAGLCSSPSSRRRRRRRGGRSGTQHRRRRRIHIVFVNASHGDFGGSTAVELSEQKACS